MSGESGESPVPRPQAPGEMAGRPRFTESEYLMILGERELRIEERERAIATLQEMLRAARGEAEALRLTLQVAEETSEILRAERDELIGTAEAAGIEVAGVDGAGEPAAQSA